MITKSWSRMNNNIVVIGIMRNLDLDHRPRRGIPNVSLLDKHATRSELPIYLSIIPIFFHTAFWSFYHSLPNIYLKIIKIELGNRKKVELVERKGCVWLCDGFEGWVSKEKRVQDRDLSKQTSELAAQRLVGTTQLLVKRKRVQIRLALVRLGCCLENKWAKSKVLQ